NGITLFRAFSRTFLGEHDAARHARVVPLRFRERAVLLALLATTLSLGLYPSGLLALRAPTVSRIVARAEGARSAGEPHGDARVAPIDELDARLGARAAEVAVERDAHARAVEARGPALTVPA